MGWYSDAQGLLVQEHNPPMMMVAKAAAAVINEPGLAMPYLTVRGPIGGRRSAIVASIPSITQQG